jgi:hypothetical protein
MRAAQIVIRLRYANNHYEGFSPATVEKFKNFWKQESGTEIGKPTVKPVERSLFD